MLSFRIGSTYRLQEGSAVAFDGAAGIVLGVPEIQRVSSIRLRKATLASAESVDQPRDLSEIFCTKYFWLLSLIGCWSGLDGHWNILNEGSR